MERQIATTASQSQRLLRCGVSADTADMCWHGAIVPRGGSLTSMPEPSEEWDLCATPYSCMPEEMQKAKLMEDYCEIQPAWSLSALLGLLPDIITYGGYQWGMFMTKLSKDCVCISYARWDNFNSTIGHLSGDVIEACVKAIEWLTKNNYKLNEI